MLMVSATGDWTRNTLEDEYPAIRRIYELYDKASYVEAVRIDAPHNYNKDSREAMYNFFAKHALGSAGTARIREQGIRLEKLQDMLALHGRTLPAGALDYAGLLTQWKATAMQQIDAIRAKEERRRLLALALGTEWPRTVVAELQGESIVLSRPGAGDRVPGLWLDGSGPPAVVIHPGGAKAARETDAVRRLRAARRGVLLVDTFQTGSAVAPRQRDTRHFLTFNRSDDALRVQDILTALHWASAKGPVTLTGLDRAAVWTRFAAAVAPVPVKLDADSTAFHGADDEFSEQFFVPGIQRAGGWKSATLLTE